MNAKKFPPALLVLLASILLIPGGCKREGPAGAGAGEAGAGEAASIPGRVISAAPSNTQIIVGLGLAERLIAVDVYSKQIEGVRQDLPEVDFFYPDAEAVIGLEPDIIISNEINSFGAANSPFKPLEEAGIRVVQIPTSTSLEGICGDILTIAEVLGVKERGEDMADTLRAEINRIAGIGKTVKNKKKIYFEVSPAPGMVTLGSGTYINEMIEIIGAVNIFADEKGWFSPGGEAILERDPDIILCMNYHGGGDAVLELQNRRGFETVTAIKEGRIYAIDGDSVGQPSQNIVSALKEMALAAYPQLYEAVYGAD